MTHTGQTGCPPLIVMYRPPDRRTGLLQIARQAMGRSVALAVALAGVLSAASPGYAQDQRPRLLVTTDIGGDPDDTQSMIRLFAHSDAYRLEGLIASASGTPSETEDATPRTDLILGLIDAYELDYPVFQQHSPFVPTASALRNLVYAGGAERGVSSLGAGGATAGSNRIITAVDASSEPLNIAIWGGATELAQALYDVRDTRTTAQVEAFVDKIRVVAIGDQDGWVDPAEGTGAWIRQNFPTLRYLDAGLNSENRFDGLYRGFYQNDAANGSTPIVPLVDDDVALLNQQAWVEANVSTGHGSLGALYPIVNQNPNTARNLSGVKEGDTPSFLYFFDNGLNVIDEPSWGGWGGRYIPTLGNPEHYQPAEDDLPDGTIDPGAQVKWSVARYREAQQSEFAARMDWFSTSYADANHAPVRIGPNAPNQYEEDPGTTITLSTSAWFDPDFDGLSYRWWFYEEPSSVALLPSALLALEQAQSTAVTFDLGLGAGTAHIILEITDNHPTTPLTRYERFVVQVGSTVIPEPGTLACGLAGAWLWLSPRRRR